MNLFISITYINATDGSVIGEEPVHETHYSHMGELYRALRSEFGACISKAFIDSRAVGWVFSKRMQYEDCPEAYIREVWVDVHTKMPTKTIEYHYANVKGETDGS